MRSHADEIEMSMGAEDAQPRSVSRRAFVSGLTAALLAPSFAARGQGNAALGSAAVRLLCGFNAGGTSDIVARIAAKAMSEQLHGNVVVENKTGAGGMIAAEQAARGAPDGHTLLLGSNATLVLNSALRTSMSYDAQRDFVAVGSLANAPLLVLARPDLGADTLGKLAALASRKPEGVTMGSAGVGAATHLGGELLASRMGVKFAHIPFPGESPALTANIGGHVDICMAAVSAALPYVKSGKLKALAVMNPKRLQVLPEVPTTFELGYPDSAASSWFGVVAPARTPANLIATLSQSITSGMSQPSTTKSLLSAGVEPMVGSADAFNQFVQKEIDRWHPLIRKLGIKID
ncbi:Bug family tripartite tricarboxylate transporter substrate binding protein [Cupriavidus sp. 30B13]|uniref:Bug family tripartite tricarboxylate transporter substrate binding protein n=1 Tax=Cupriavidus sp. 30B13 TaxID=3384241 RepID=UPI003B91048C